METATLQLPKGLIEAAINQHVQVAIAQAMGGRAFAEATPGAMKEAAGNRSGQIPAADVRLTANIRGDLHLKLKIRAAEQRTTVGELIEQWIESWR